MAISHPPTLSREQIDILDHTVKRAPNGFYCGGGPAMDDLVAQGLMTYAGQTSFSSDKYYEITSYGRQILREHYQSTNH